MKYFKMILCLVFVMIPIMVMSEELFERDRSLGYSFDVMLVNYDPDEEKADFKCNLDLYIRKLRPAYTYTEADTLSSNGSIPAMNGDRGNNGKITQGATGSGGEMRAKPRVLHKCNISLADGRTDEKTIDVITLDGYPIVWFQSSKFPEAEVVPYGALFWIVYSALGYNIEVDIDFSLCDPRSSECMSSKHQYNEEEYPDKKIGQYGRTTIMTGLAIRSGYYTVTATNEIAPRQAYFHLKVADPVAASWSTDASVTEPSHRVADGEDLTLTCSFISPVPYRSKRYWFKNGSYRIRPSDKFTFSNDDGVLTLRGVEESDSGDYTCKVDFSDWSEDISALDATTKVEVTGGPSSAPRGPHICLFLPVLAFLSMCLNNIQ